MDNKDIKKEDFNANNFSAINFLNKNLSKTNTESDIFSFKLKILQREFTNEIELNSNNINKAFKNYNEDLGNLRLLANNFYVEIDDLANNIIKKDEYA
jgi:hypothetical protein